MRDAVASFTSEEHTHSDALNALSAAGMTLGPERDVERTVLDSYDGRLHSARLRLELRRSVTLDLALTERSVSPTRARVTSEPRFAIDLPAGPFRDRVSPVLEVRALLPVVTVAERETEAVLCAESGEAVAVAVVHSEPAGSGAPTGFVPWTVDVVSLRGHRKVAKRLRAHLEDLGFRWLPGDALDLAIAAAGVDPAGFNSSPTIALDPSVGSLEAYRAVLSNLAGAIVANWQGTVDDVDAEFLHELRVAVRRTRTVLSQAKEVIPASVRDHYRESFGWFGQITGPARDLDVNVIEWDDYVAALSPATVEALEPVRAHLLAQRRDAHRVLADELSSPRATEIMSSWQAWLAHADVEAEPDSDGERAAGLVVARRIRRAQRRLLVRGRGITADSPAEDLHELRKDAKKLRYLLECFGGLLASRPRKAFVGRLKALQENLGQHQDNEVHVTKLHAIARELGTRGASTDTLVGIGELAAHHDQRRLAARTEFATQFASYDSPRSKRALRKMLAGLA